MSDKFWWILISKIYFLKYWEGEEETNEIFVHGWAGAADTVLSISQIPAGINAKSECKKRIYDRILERCIPVKIDGVSRREAITKDNMQTMKNILKS